MLEKDRKIAIYMEASLGRDDGKLGYGVMRYGSNPIVCVIDSMQAGKTVSDVCALPFDHPVVDSIEAARAMGAEVLVLGTAPSGGFAPQSWYPHMQQALQLGMSLVNGMHTLLADELGETISDPQSQFIWDTRKPGFTPQIARARAAALDNLRVLMVGTDMAIGKMTAGLEIYRWITGQNVTSSFIATGQVGITITGSGIPLDAFIVDQACGAVESAVLEAADSDVVFIEGQGSLLHPGSTATLPLMRGSCANRLIMCHRAGKTHLQNPSHIKVPPLKDFIKLNEDLAGACGSLTRPETTGIALNTAGFDDAQADQKIKRLEDETGLPVEDVVRNGAAKLGRAILGLS